MHTIGKKIVYGSSGVMTIVDIREETITDTPRSYYVLRAAVGSSDSLVFVPTDNEKLVAYMHELLSSEEIHNLIDSPIDSSVIEWNDNSRARTEYFKRIMESGDRLAMLSMIRAIYESGQRRLEIGKKNFLSDESTKQKAERLLATEFSIVLGITEEEALERIREKVEK